MVFVQRRTWPLGSGMVLLNFYHGDSWSLSGLLILRAKIYIYIIKEEQI